MIKLYALSDEEFNQLTINRKEFYRFTVESRFGALTYDTFQTMDDCFNFLMEMARKDLSLIEEVQIYDKISHLVFKPSNLNVFFRDYGYLVKGDDD